MTEPSNSPPRQPETPNQQATQENSSRRFAALPQEGRLELVHGEEVSRILIVMLGDFLARVNRERRLVYQDDLDMAAVFDVIGIAAISHSLRDAKFREQHGTFSSVIGADGQRGTNAMSISAGTGIPRETVRRKIKRLVELGLVEEKTRGHYIVTPGTFLKPQFQEGFARGVRETLNFMNQCLEQGVMRWVPHPKKANGKA